MTNKASPVVTQPVTIPQERKQPIDLDTVKKHRAPTTA